MEEFDDNRGEFIEQNGWRLHLVISPKPGDEYEYKGMVAFEAFVGVLHQK